MAASGVDSLSAKIVSLSSDVKKAEARRVAESAHSTSAQLSRDYRVFGPALVHNVLVNTGLRQRGLCYQWTHDLVVRLAALNLTTLDLHWAVARSGTFREHNCVVVTAKGQPFQSGIILDAWRKSGRLFFAPVATDHYPWKPDTSEWARLAAPGQPSARPLN